MTQSWAELPLDRPIILDGVNAESFALAIEPLPADAPAIVTYHAALQVRQAQLVSTLLAELDRIARELFPAWLPAAAKIESSAGAGAVAVRALALRAAETTGQYGPFLADLAERSLNPVGSASSPFHAEVRAAGLAKVIAAAYGRSGAAVVVPVGEGLSPDQQHALVAGARWLSDSGRFGIWFIGAGLAAVDGVERVWFRQSPSHLSPALNPRPVDGPADGAVTTYPAIAGRPHPGSEAEKLLEAALHSVEWAAGREWNQTYWHHPLTNPVRLDLLWRHERCVVEIDGAEHCQQARFAEDRKRDVLLQLAGYAVLRFTNHQVLMDRDVVLTQIQQFLVGRRAGRQEGATHVGSDSAGAEAVAVGAGSPAHPDGREQ